MPSDLYESVLKVDIRQGLLARTKHQALHHKNHFGLKIMRLRWTIKRNFAAVVTILGRLSSDMSIPKLMTLCLCGAVLAVLICVGGDFIFTGAHPRQSKIEAIGDIAPGLPLLGNASRRMESPVNWNRLASHNPFRSLTPQHPVAAKIVVPPAPPPAPRVPLKDRAAGLRLMGILSSQPLQAIVEDTVNHQTLYVSEGNAIGGITVEKVLPDKIILTYEDERLDLIL